MDVPKAITDVGSPFLSLTLFSVVFQIKKCPPYAYHHPIAWSRLQLALKK
jgi:hypothetical protein